MWCCILVKWIDHWMPDLRTLWIYLLGFYASRNARFVMSSAVPGNEVELKRQEIKTKTLGLSSTTSSTFPISTSNSSYNPSPPPGTSHQL